MRSPPLRLKAGVHRVVDLPITRYLRRSFHDPHLMTYVHALTGNLMIGSWVSRSGGIILEHGLCDRGEHDAVTQLHWQRSEQCRLDCRKMAREMKSSEREDIRKQAEDADEEASFIDWIRRRCPTSVQDHPAWSYC